MWENRLKKESNEVTFENAAAIPCAGFTSWQILSRKIPVKPSQTVLIHAGAGGFGGFDVQLGHYLGLNVIATCSEGNFSYVKNLGADHLIDYRNDNVSDRIDELTGGRGVEIAVNTIDSESATQDLKRLAFGGHLACVAGLPDFSRIKPFTRALSIHESALGGAHLSGDLTAQLELAEMGKELISIVSNDNISAMLMEVILLDDIPKALISISRRHTRGKIVAEMEK